MRSLGRRRERGTRLEEGQQLAGDLAAGWGGRGPDSLLAPCPVHSAMLYGRACCPVAKTRGRSPAGASARKSQEMPPAPAGPRGVVVRDAHPALTPHAPSARPPTEQL